MADDSTSNPWQTVSCVDVLDCPYFRVRSDRVRHRGKAERDYTSIRFKSGAVTVIPLDDRGYTTLVGQYRHPLDRFTWEAPGGAARLDAPALEGARRELREEAGYLADNWLPILMTAPSPANSDECSNGFLAWGLQAGWRDRTRRRPS